MVGWMVVAGVASAAAPPATPSTWVGAGLSVALDVPDGGAPALQTKYFPAPSLLVPVSIGLTPDTSLRITGRGTFAIGRDLISWEVPGVGRFAEQNRTLAGVFSLGLGPEIRLSRDNGDASPSG